MELPIPVVALNGDSGFSADRETPPCVDWGVQGDGGITRRVDIWEMVSVDNDTIYVCLSELAHPYQGNAGLSYFAIAGADCATSHIALGRLSGELGTDQIRYI